MEELDLLKKDWKKNQNFPEISENEIYGMLHKKSSSIVKLILIISILEVVLWFFVGLLFDSEEYFKKLNSSFLVDFFNVFTVLNYAVIAAFIYIFYKNYKNICVVSSTKHLMKSILNTRKTVNYYIWYNLAMIIVGTILGFILAFNTDPNLIKLTEHNDSVFYIAIAICLVAVVVLVGVFWLFYRLLYGILLKKLYKNYNELKKIDL